MVRPAPSLHHWAASAWVAWCVSCGAMTCHGPAFRTANNAARFCPSWSPLTLRGRSCTEGSLGWLIEPSRGLQGAPSSILRLVCAACRTICGLPKSLLLMRLAWRGCLPQCCLRLDLDLLLSRLTVRLSHTTSGTMHHQLHHCSDCCDHELSGLDKQVQSAEGC
jgi:hypothetical protein